MRLFKKSTIYKTIYLSIIVFIISGSIFVIYYSSRFDPSKVNNQYYSDKRTYTKPIYLILGKVVTKSPFIGDRQKVIYNYDFEKKIIEKKVNKMVFYSMPIPNFSKESIIFEYNNSWELIKEHYGGDSYYEYEYKEHKITVRPISDEGIIEFEYIYHTEYDSSDNLIYCKISRSDSKYYVEYFYEYNSNKNLVKEIIKEYSIDGSTDTDEKFYYYNSKDQIEEIIIKYKTRQKKILIAYSNDLITKVYLGWNGENFPEETIYITYNNENLPREFWSSLNNYRTYIYYKVLNKTVPIPERSINENFFIKISSSRYLVEDFFIDKNELDIPLFNAFVK